MTEEEILAMHRQFHTLLADQLGPLMSQDGQKGVVCMRVFYALATGEGAKNVSAGQAGLTQEGHQATAIELIRKIPMILIDPDGNREMRVIEVEQKQ
jgi:hypothetical protein